MKFLDLFSGIGGFRTGLEASGHKCVGYVEFDKFARESYQAIYDTKGEFTAYDIREVKGGELPEAQLWCFGFPCQDISVAGHQKGLKQGTRSGLFFEVIRLLQERAELQKTLPTYLLIENVKNLLSIDGGWGFARLQFEMDEMGYDTEWSIFNSSEVVPQNRERIYIIGRLRETGAGRILPIQRKGKTTNKEQPKVINSLKGKTSSGWNFEQQVYEKNGIARTAKANDGSGNILKIIEAGNFGGQKGKRKNPDRGRVFSKEGIASTLTATMYKRSLHIAEKSKIKQYGNYISTSSFGGNPQVGRVYDPTGLSPTLSTMQGGDRQPKITVKACLTPEREKKRQNGRRFKEDGEPSFTITAVDRNGVLIDDGNLLAIRKLTPLECWRLQGFSDEQYDKAKRAGVSKTQLYKQAGNAVTTKVVQAIGEKLKQEEKHV